MQEMRKQGCVLLVFGAIFLAAGGAVVLAGLFGVGGPFVASRLPLAPPPSEASSSLELTPDRPYLLGLYLHVRSEAVRRLEPGRLGLRRQRELLYRFAVRGTVATGSGHILAGADRFCSPGSERTVVRSRLEGRGGTVEVRHPLAAFEAPRSGTVKLTAELEPDERYGARVLGAEVQVYELSPFRHFVVPASAMVMMAPVLLFIGLVTYLIGRVTGEGKTVPIQRRQPEQEDAPEAE